MLTTLIDPSDAPLRTAPTKVDDWLVQAKGSWVVTLDNLSSIQPWLSDALCRAATGEGSVTRMLYTDADLAVLQFRRVCMLTAIDAGALRGDLGDRLLPIELEEIPPTKRREDGEVARAFAAMHPRVFGALLDLVARVWNELPGTRLAELPRMADFAKILATIDPAALGVYAGLQESIASDVVDGDVIAVAVRDIAAAADGEWEGTAGSKHSPSRRDSGGSRSDYNPGEAYYRLDHRPPARPHQIPLHAMPGAQRSPRASLQQAWCWCPGRTDSGSSR